jgi:excisionase family DNA binding protein
MLTVPEAARRTGRHPETIRRWIREGKLTASKVGTQHVIDEEDLTFLLRDGRPPRRGGAGRAAQISEALAPYVAGSRVPPRPAADDWLPYIVGRIARTIDPARIILFGSRARGDARPDSDYDLLVILDSVGHRREERIRIRGAFEDLPVAADVLVATTAEANGEVPGRPTGAVYWALRDGRTVYARDSAH